MNDRAPDAPQPDGPVPAIRLDKLEDVPGNVREGVRRQLRRLGVDGDPYPRQPNPERKPQPWDRWWQPKPKD